jgi:peptidoglycan/xylan/chitin deacetylase (PgdA/CDA1 family)
MISYSTNRIFRACMQITARAFTGLGGPRLLILMYHRFMADGDAGYVLKQGVFREQIRFIKDRFTVVALEEYLSLSESQKKKVERPMALTVDDGYRNFYLYAFPVLQEYSLPATVFVPVNFVEQGGWMWQDKNKHILRTTAKSRITLKWKDRTHIFEVGAFDTLMKSLDDAYDLCMKEPLEERADFSRKLADAAGVDLPDKPEGEFEPLRWEEMREMEKAGIHFGSHTMNHEILMGVDAAQVRYELGDSKKILEDRLGHEITGFCYPNGDFDGTVMAAVSECGYMYAVSTRGGYNTKATMPMALNRESAPSYSDKDVMEHCCYVVPLKHHVISMMNACR